MDHTDTEVQLGATSGSRDNSDEVACKLEMEPERNMRCLEMCKRELEEYERTLRDREQYMTAYDAKMHARGNRLGMGQRPQRDRARRDSGDRQPGENAEGYVLRQLVQSLSVKNTPTFKGDGKEDPI